MLSVSHDALPIFMRDWYCLFSFPFLVLFSIFFLIFFHFLILQKLSFQTTQVMHRSLPSPFRLPLHLRQLPLSKSCCSHSRSGRTRAGDPPGASHCRSGGYLHLPLSPLDFILSSNPPVLMTNPISVSQEYNIGRGGEWPTRTHRRRLSRKKRVPNKSPILNHHYLWVVLNLIISCRSYGTSGYSLFTTPYCRKSVWTSLLNY